jgi:hypothetical protein
MAIFSLHDVQNIAEAVLLGKGVIAPQLERVAWWLSIFGVGAVALLLRPDRSHDRELD